MPRDAFVGILPARRPEREFGSFLRCVPLDAALAAGFTRAGRVTRGISGLRGMWRARGLARDGGVVMVPFLPSWFKERDLRDLAALKRAGGRLVVDVADRPLWQAETFGVAIPAERKARIAALEDGLLDLADLVVANAPEWVPDRPHVVARNATEARLFDGGAPVAPTGLVLYTGSVAPARGIDDLVRAVALARKSVPHARLRIVTATAHPPWVAGLDALARELAVPLELHLDVPRERLAPLHTDANVAVLPARDTPYLHITDPLKLYDYMAAARPLVTPPARAPASVVRAEGAGVVARSFELSDVADALAGVLADPKAAGEMGRRGRAAVEARHEWRHRAAAIRGPLGS